VFVGEMLEEIATALEDAEATPDTGFKPEGIVEGWTVSAVFCAVKNLKKRLEEFFTDD
jgi:hypothetical protein